MVRIPPPRALSTPPHRSFRELQVPVRRQCVRVCDRADEQHHNDMRTVLAGALDLVPAGPLDDEVSSGAWFKSPS